MRKLILIATLISACVTAYALPQSAAFYYGNDVPVNQLKLFNTVVVESEYVPNPADNETARSHWYAYVSVGEVNPQSWYYKAINKNWILGTNANWGSKVLDQDNIAWHKFFVNTVIKKLWQQGYRRFFFDTMDSYNLYAKTEAARNKERQGLIGLLGEVKSKYPAAQIILNRGFSLLPQVQHDIQGVAAESLYDSYDFKQKQYVKVTPSDREWLLNKLNYVKSLGLKVFVIDYLPLYQHQAALADAARISRDGFIPYVSDINLEGLGVSNIAPIPRDVIMLYSSAEESEKILSAPAIYLSAPLNYLGFVPKIYAIEDALPSYPLANRVAGVAVWLDGRGEEKNQNLMRFINAAIAQQIPLVFFGNVDYLMANKKIASKLKLHIAEEPDNKGIVISKINRQYIGFESQPIINSSDFTGFSVANANNLLQIKNSQGDTSNVVAITPWGGYALAPYIVNVLPNNQSSYIINPFRLLQATLRLPEIAIPDVTTENGRRILISHVDGDAFISKSEWARGPYAAESLLRTILDKYKIPVAISIVEGEIGPQGLEPENAATLMQIARRIFALPWVEIASHSYSHPFDWNAAYKNSGTTIPAEQGYTLPIKGYKFNLQREIIGSTDFINNQLAPQDKKCKIFLWTGDTNPPEQAVAMTYKIGLLNMNGGNTIINKLYPSLTAVSGMGIYKGKYLQVFAPIQNENLYTELWQGPFYGYRRVVETFAMTNVPRRLKPMGIYYHFYSASKEASLKALDYVYAWTLKQPVTPEFTSSYIKKVMDFYAIAEAKVGDAWLIHSDGNVKEFRIPDNKQFPKIGDDFIGYNTFNDSNYAHTNNKNYLALQLTTKASDALYLKDANSILLDYRHDNQEYDWSFQAYIPFVANFANAKNCKFKLNGTAINPVYNNSLATIKAQEAGNVRLQAHC